MPCRTERMGHWGVKSYENDEAADAIDAALERVHGDAYDALMDDRNPLTFDQVQEQLASPETLAAAVEALARGGRADTPFDDWDEVERLGVRRGRRPPRRVRRAGPRRLARPGDRLARNRGDRLGDEATVRRLRRQKEIALLRSRQAVN